MKIRKVKKLVTNLHDKKIILYVTHIAKLKQALNYELVLREKKIIIRFNQRDWLKSYIDISTELKKKEKIDFKKYISSWLTMQNVRKQRYQASSNCSRKELFSTRTKLLSKKKFFLKIY